MNDPIPIEVRISLGRLRTILHREIQESGGGTAGYPQIHDAVGPSMAEREAIGSLADNPDAEPGDDLPPHLRQPLEDPEDTMGPVAPSAEDPYMIADPYASDYGVLPRQGSGRK